MLISARNTEARSDIYNTDVIAAWMFINHTLTVNGFEVINGYSDILHAVPWARRAARRARWVGGRICGRFTRPLRPLSGGGRLPIQRYPVSRSLNRITFYEFDQLRKLTPASVNRLPADSLYYDPAIGSEPQRNFEVIQSWEAVKALNGLLVADDQMKSLKELQRCRGKSDGGLRTDSGALIRLDQKSNAEHLQPLADGLRLFAKLAELEEAAM